MSTVYGDRRRAVYTIATVLYLTGLFLCKKALSAPSNVLVGIIRIIVVFVKNFDLIYYNLHKYNVIYCSR